MLCPLSVIFTDLHSVPPGLCWLGRLPAGWAGRAGAERPGEHRCRCWLSVEKWSPPSHHLVQPPETGIGVISQTEDSGQWVNKTWQSAASDMTDTRVSRVPHPADVRTCMSVTTCPVSCSGDLCPHDTSECPQCCSPASDSVRSHHGILNPFFRFIHRFSGEYKPPVNSAVKLCSNAKYSGSWCHSVSVLLSVDTPV